MNDVTSTIVSQPGTRNAPASFEMSVPMPNMKAMIETTKPMSSTSRSGFVEKLSKPVGGETDHPPDRVLRFSGEPRRRRVRDADLAKAEPGEHAAHEPVLLRHRAEGLDDAAVGEAEVACGGGDLDAGEPAQHAVVRACRGLLEPALGAVDHHPVDDLVAVAPSRRELREHLRRMLEVAVHHDHRVAACEIDSGADRQLVAEVPRELRDLETRVGAMELEHRHVAEVVAAVVDEDHLDVAVELGEYRCESAVELGQRLLLVVYRYDDRVGGVRRAHRQCTRTVTGGPTVNTSP